MARFETETLSTKGNLKLLMELSGKWIDQAHQHRKLTKLILDMDSSVSETYGHQEGSAYNGHFECTCYHPAFVFNQFGDLERVMLRRGNRGSAKFWRTGAAAGDRPLPEPRHPQVLPRRLRVCGSEAAALAGVGRLPLRHPPQDQSGAGTQDCPLAQASCGPAFPQAEGLLSQLPLSGRFVGVRPPRRGPGGLACRAKLFPRVGFVVTNLKWHSKKVVHFYNRRGTAEQWIKEGKNAVKWTKLSCRRFKDNAARLQLFALAYNLANFLRQLVLPKPIKGWTLTTLREKLIKIGLLSYIVRDFSVRSY